MSNGGVASVAAFYRGRPVLVTGGAGFIGSHLVDGLAEHGARVTVIDDLSNGREANLAHHLADSRSPVRFIPASILDEQVLDQAMRGTRIVFHQAALGSVPHSVEHPDLFERTNGTGTFRVLEAARRAGVERVIYAGSSSAYGDSPTLPKREDMMPAPKSPYAASKLSGEQWLQSYASCYGLSGVTLRYFNVFGPRQRPDSAYAAVVPAFAQALANGSTPVIHGDGTQSRDFTFVRNVVHANLLAGAAKADLRGEVVNIACGERYSLLQLLEAMAAIMGCEPRSERRPERAGDVKHSQADITRSRELLGYETIIGFHDGLRETLRSFQPAHQR